MLISNRKTTESSKVLYVCVETTEKHRTEFGTPGFVEANFER